MTETMRRPRSSLFGPASVNRYLLPSEQTIITMRRHPAVLLIPLAEAVSGPAVALILNWTLISSLTVRVAVWTGVAFLVFQSLSYVMSWAQDYTVVTAYRVLVVHGSGRSTVEEMALDSLKDMALDRPFAGRILGYGTFYLSSGGRRQVLMDYVPYPEHLYLEIKALLFESDD
jgi:hypothetical protein